MTWETYVQKEIISARFILALLVVGGFLLGRIDATVSAMVLAFYFGSKAVSYTYPEPVVAVPATTTPSSNVVVNVAAAQPAIVAPVATVDPTVPSMDAVITSVTPVTPVTT